MQKTLYEKNNANLPRLDTDTFFVDFKDEHKYYGYINDMVEFINGFQLKNTEHWARFVEQFRHDADGADGGWRGEYWGKLMRGACFVYSLNKDPELYAVLKKAVSDMIDSAENDGRISSYARESEFNGWDMWCRKYVLLGMQYFIEICDEADFVEKIIASMKGQVDYLMQHIGDDKMVITSTSTFWEGLNSSSILEPVVRLYNITGEEKYLTFAEHIVKNGGIASNDVVKLVLESDILPYQLPVKKAYEMISFFEGILEYYRVTKEEKYKTAVIAFADRILKSDFTVIGCCGCYYENFDNSTVRQANTNPIKIQQETCVTVTLMKYMYQLTLLTGDAKYVDAFERSMYNAYLGAINTEKVTNKKLEAEHPEYFIEPLPFDSYSPLVAAARGIGIGGMKVMRDNHYYGCCVCISPAGLGMFAKMALLSSKNGFALNLYNEGVIKATTPAGNAAVFTTETEYPKSGNIKVTLNLNTDEEFELKVRNPEWSKTTTLLVNGESVPATEGYITLNRVWKDGDTIELILDMRTQAFYVSVEGPKLITGFTPADRILPAYEKDDPLAKERIALRRGPVFLAQENRLGCNVDEATAFEIGEDGYVEVEVSDKVPFRHLVGAEVPLKDGSKMLLCDYASAGKLWTEESKMAVWMLSK